MGGAFDKKGKARKYEDALEMQEMEQFNRVRMSKKEKKQLKNQ